MMRIDSFGQLIVCAKLSLTYPGCTCTQIDTDTYVIHTYTPNFLAYSIQVAERALYYWNSEHLCVNVLSQSRASVFLPYVFGPLSKNAQGHWNQTVEGLAQSVLKMYVYDMSLCFCAFVCVCLCLLIHASIISRCF
jgi:hypothetical protein